ncbi:NEL-type E3 ubiquitin ligase domain-containing protein [Pseudomonas triticicola]|uniref:NEL-type E3 ubiquitin ligase domain-containing protein n=1 Tax=Pseudomonas triticicola TaxID=2842345 RepID=UPI003EB732F5
MLTQDTKSAKVQNSILRTLFDATGDLDIAETLQKNLPPHLLTASPATLVALDQTVRDLHSLQLRVEKDLTRLESLQRFCVRELTAAMNRKWPAVYDVERDLLSLPGLDCGCEAVATDESGVEVIKHATQTLLQAAMQNFTEDEEQTDAFPTGSFVRVHSAPGGVKDLTPAAFATLCRKLNLGKKYQLHLQKVFGLVDEAGEVVASSAMTRDIVAMKKHLLRLDAELAWLKGDITSSGLRMVKDLIEADGVASPQTLRYGKHPMIMQGIEILDSCVWGVVVFSERSLELHPEDGCLVYMPGESARALYEYPNLAAFRLYLTQQLQKTEYCEYFARSLDEDDKADFFKAFADKGEVGVIKQLSINVSLFDFMLQSHIGKRQIDALRLAVPTADIDEDARRKRVQGWLESGVTLASLAGLFVPVLGQLMMGVAVGQLLGEVFEGVEDWQRGDHQQALSHLLSVVENIALMGVFAGGQKALGALGNKLLRSHPEFFGQFAAILDHAARPRLWKPELSHYEHEIPAGFTIDAGSEEFYRIGVKTIGRVDHRLLAGKYDAASQSWRLEHARRAPAYGPQLDRHVEGGWRLPAEAPEEWSSSAYTLKRIDPQLSEFVDSDLDMMRRLSDTSHEALLQTFNDNLKLPVRLRDTVERVRLARQLRELTIELRSGECHSGQPVEEQLHALPTLSGWPTDRYIKVTSGENAGAAYPSTRLLDDTLSVEVTPEQLSRGQLLQTVIDGLYQREVKAMLGGKVAKSTQASALAKKLAAALTADHRAAFKRMYQRYDRSEASELVKLRKVFADIPARHGQRLIDRATSVERQHLSATGRVPLRLAQRVTASIDEVRLDRALAGFHWPRLANDDTDALAIRLLPRLSGWDPQLRLQLREKTLAGPVLEDVGDTAASAQNTCTLVKSASGYEAFNGAKTSLGKVAPAPEALFNAIFKALPQGQRSVKGFAADARQLRSSLLDAALDERQVSAGALRNPRTVEIEEPACVQGDQVPATRHPRGLLRKVRRLYPRLSETQASQLLDGLGTDPLSRATRVKALQQELKTLRDALFVWSEDTLGLKALGGDLAEARHSRKMTAELIEEGFRRFHWVPDEQGQSLCTLNLDGMRIGKLPTLPPGGSFDHIQQLSMKNMAQSDDVAHFLKSFKQLESLELDNNSVTRLPEMLSYMPRLQRLSLANNQLRLTEPTLAKLKRMTTLQYLNLNGNPLGATPDVGAMRGLRRLLLRETGLTEMPTGLEKLPCTEWVDLRSNQIKNLPDWLFQKKRWFSQALNLRFNPLSASSATHLENYRNNTGVGMGYLNDDIARLDEQKARSLWMIDSPPAQALERERIWNAFKDDERGEALFHLLSELGDTADATQASADMRARVWAVLEAAQREPVLCDQLLNLAANPINCTDSAAMNFSHLEVAVEVDRVSNVAGGRPVTAKPLLELGKRLFRLKKLDDIALEHVRKHPKADALEVNLAYRTGLAEALDLPGQPRRMQFAEQGGVTTDDLEVARNRITSAELSPQWLKFMQQQGFWTDYLQRTFARKFSPIDALYAPRIDAVFEQADTLPSADYLSQMDAIRLERDQAQQAVIKLLTEESIRLMDLGLCAMPDE